MKIAALILTIVICAGILASWSVSTPIFNERLERIPDEAFQIEAPHQALTFARTTSDELLLVLRANQESAEVVDLSAAMQQELSDPLQALRQFSYAQIAAAASNDTETYALEELGLPLVPHYPHIAAGTNFRAHAEEVGIEEGPFLFPKLTRATPWNADVPLRTRLDYEAELCAVPLHTYTATTQADFGFVLCSDFTDRWTLVKDIDLDAPMGRTGFSDAKGGPGMLSIGPFFVVPQDDATFYPDLHLGLYLNEDLRQRDRAGLMIWTPHEIASQALQQCDAEFLTDSGMVGLTSCGSIAAGTLLLTGTPAGVLFHLANLWNPTAYVQAGDTVTTYATGLGMLQNRVKETTH